MSVIVGKPLRRSYASIKWEISICCTSTLTLKNNMDKITSLLAVIAFVAANTQHQDQVYNILVVVKKNSSVFQEAKGLIRKNFSSSLNGYWAVNFIEYRVISSVPQSFLILANNFTRNSTFDGIIFVDISKSTAMLSQSLMAIIPTIGLQDTGPEVLVRYSNCIHFIWT